MRRLVVIILLSPFVVACGGNRDGQIVDFCESRQQPTRGIVNGVVSNEFSATIAILTSSGGTCTGTAISKTTLITAAHCITNKKITYKDKNLISTTTAVTREGIDLAVAVFPPDTFSTVAYLISSAPKVGDILAIIGYGQTGFVNNNQADGQKRIGCNVIGAFANVVPDTSISMMQTLGNYLFYQSPVVATGTPGSNAMSGHGDSGGGVYVNGQLAGVTNFGDQRSKLYQTYQNRITGDVAQGNSDALYEYDTTLYSRVAVNFLRQAQGQTGADIPGLDDLDSAVRSSGF